jgi:transposase-like protein
VRVEAREAALVLLIAGHRLHDVAERVGVAEATLRKWRHQPTFARRLAEARQEAVDAAIARLTEHSAAAATRILSLMAGAGSDAVQLRAAIAALEVGQKLRTGEDVEQRLAAIERLLQEGAGGQR